MKSKRDRDEAFRKEIRKLPCIVCGAAPPSTVSHTRTVGSGGGDDAFNLSPMCIICHGQWEINKPQFLDRHPHFAQYLQELGWRWGNVLGRFKMWVE